MCVCACTYVCVCVCVCVCVRPPDEPEYCPDSALSEALRDWMDELNQPLQPGEATADVIADVKRSKTASV